MRWVCVLMPALLLPAAAPMGAQASLDRHTNSDWKGITDQGGEVKMLILRPAPGEPRVIHLWAYAITFECDNGGGGETVISFGGSDFPIVNGYASFDLE